jgi:hypothetical protein
MKPEGLAMLMLLVAGFTAANLIMLVRLWWTGRKRRQALRKQLDRIQPARRRPHR